jgi:hypothetical protein
MMGSLMAAMKAVHLAWRMAALMAG